MPDCPYIIKSPWLCDYLAHVLESGRIKIDHAYIPFRALPAAAESRIFVEKQVNGPHSYKGCPGGLWHTRNPEEQESILARQFFKLVTVLGEWDIPTTFLSYPKLVRDPEYLYRKLRFLVEDIEFTCFERVFRGTVRPEWVHSFGEEAGDGK